MKRAESIFRRISLHFWFVKLMASKIYAQYRIAAIFQIESVLS